MMAVDEVDLRVIRRIADMHAVYRMFDASGRLLYIGRTGNAGRRFGDHNSKRWFPLVAEIKLEWFATEAATVLAERRAIQAEHPRYNIADRKPSSTRPARPRRRQPVKLSLPAPPRSPSETVALHREAVMPLLAAGTTASRVAESLGVSKWTARVCLVGLRSEGVAQLEGSKRGARWHLADHGDAA